MYMDREGIYSKELAHIIMETDKAPDLQGDWARDPGQQQVNTVLR